MANVIAIDGVSGVGKTTFLDYIRNNTKYKVIVPSSYCDKLKAPGHKGRNIWLEVWSKVYLYTRHLKDDDVLFLDRSIASYHVYQSEHKELTNFLLALIHNDDTNISYHAVLFDTTMERLKLNKGIKKKETPMDYFGLTSHKASIAYKKSIVWGNGWDLIIDPYGYRRNKGKLLHKILKACDVC